MPASIAHILIAQRARAHLVQHCDQDLAAFAREVLEKHSHFMSLGSLGPDLPYFGLRSLRNPARPIGVDQWSYQLHSKTPNEFPLRMIELTWRHSNPLSDDWSEGDKCRFAFLSGFLTHVAADQIVHPVVNLIAGRYFHCHVARDTHRDCEVFQDLYMLSRERHHGRLTLAQFRSERFHSECNNGRDADAGDLQGNEFLYFIQRAFVEAHAVTPSKVTLQRRMRLLWLALRFCRYWGWYRTAQKRLFSKTGDLRRDCDEYQRYIQLEGLVGKELFGPNKVYDDFFDEASQLAVLYVQAAYQLYRAPRVDDALRSAFRDVVVNADLGCPLQLRIFDTASEALPRLKTIVDELWRDDEVTASGQRIEQVR